MEDQINQPLAAPKPKRKLNLTEEQRAKRRENFLKNVKPQRGNGNKSKKQAKPTKDYQIMDEPPAEHKDPQPKEYNDELLENDYQEAPKPKAMPEAPKPPPAKKVTKPRAPKAPVAPPADPYDSAAIHALLAQQARTNQLLQRQIQQQDGGYEDEEEEPVQRPAPRQRAPRQPQYQPQQPTYTERQAYDNISSGYLWN